MNAEEVEQVAESMTEVARASMASQRESNQRLLILTTSGLGALLFLGGIIVALVGRGAQTQFILFGQRFTSTSVGVALAFIGAVVVVLTIKPIIKSLDSVGPSGGDEFLPKDSFRGLLAEFDSDAFKTTLPQEGSIILFKNRVDKIYDILDSQIGRVHPDYRGYMVDVFTLVKALKERVYSIPSTAHSSNYVSFTSTGIVIDSLRYQIVGMINDLSKAVGHHRRIDALKIIKGAAKSFGSNWSSYMDDELAKATSVLSQYGLDPEIAEMYVAEVTSSDKTGVFI